MAYSSKKARGQAIQDLTVCMLFMYVLMYYTNRVRTREGDRAMELSFMVKCAAILVAYLVVMLCGLAGIL